MVELRLAGARLPAFGGLYWHGTRRTGVICRGDGRAIPTRFGSRKLCCSRRESPRCSIITEFFWNDFLMLWPWRLHRRTRYWRRGVVLAITAGRACCIGVREKSSRSREGAFLKMRRHFVIFLASDGIPPLRLPASRFVNRSQWSMAMWSACYGGSTIANCR